MVYFLLVVIAISLFVIIGVLERPLRNLNELGPLIREEGLLIRMGLLGLPRFRLGTLRWELEKHLKKCKMEGENPADDSKIRVFEQEIDVLEQELGE